MHANGGRAQGADRADARAGAEYRVASAGVKAGAPTIANDALRYLKAIYGFGRRRQIVASNPASDFRLEDAGGKERSRTRALRIEEITQLFRAMAFTRTLGRENELALKLLLLLGVRKQELMCACWKELNLDGALWTLPAERTKTAAEIKIPLPALGVKWFRELHGRAGGGDYVFPARRLGRRDLGHLAPDTLNVALARIDHGLEPFTLHDLRRTLSETSHFRDSVRRPQPDRRSQTPSAPKRVSAAIFQWMWNDR